MTKNLIITAAWLVINSACEKQVEEFRKMFGKKAVITPEVMRKYAHRFDLAWLASRVLNSEDYETFLELETKQDIAWGKVQDALDAKYFRLKSGRERRKIDWDAYNKALSAKWTRAYNRNRRAQGELLMSLPRRQSSVARYATRRYTYRLVPYGD